MYRSQYKKFFHFYIATYFLIIAFHEMQVLKPEYILKENINL